jgi:hypothetical protein
MMYEERISAFHGRRKDIILGGGAGAGHGLQPTKESRTPGNPLI